MEENKEIFASLLKAKKQLKQPKKSAWNDFTKSNYVTLESLQKTVDEALEDTGLGYIQKVANTDNGVSVNTVLFHETGQSLESGWLTLTPKKNDPQGLGSAITYAKRYQLSAIFGISSAIEDDDGNAASGRQFQYNNQRRQPTSKKMLAEYKTWLLKAEKALNLSEDKVSLMLRNKLSTENFESNAQKLERSIEVLKEAVNQQ